MASEVLESEPMTREEAKRILRRLELDAYSAIVTAFRAQGDISKTKKSILTELSNELSISTERHRAEVRRVVNDDRLSAVAECMYGSGTSTEWSIEGRRLVSLMPRLVPQTVFTAKATAAANQTVELNQKLPIKTEIEVLPLPTKQKTLPKSERAPDMKEESKDAANSMKVEDKAKKKKKPTIPYSKPSPIALNKTLTNPFKPSAPSLKPIIKSTTLKYSSNSVQKTTVSSPSTTTAKYSPKPIILQKSPTKTQATVSRPNLHLQTLSSSSVNSSLTSLSSLSSSKGESSLHLIQSPMIKVVSSSLCTTLNSTSVSGGLQNNSITQKIKFKTPLPKPKVKPAKFKPMVPLQRPGLLSSSQSSDGIGIGVSSVTSSSVSPDKSTTGMQGMSVKVVQVAKSGISGSLGSSSLINYSNKPVVVVPSSAKTPPHKVLSFNSISSAPSQPLKVSNIHSSPVTTSLSLQKGALSSKSMPLATGFKMIAVTTVVPGTTQVKTVYIATPIMSLTKSISQTTSSSITTPATQNKHSSLASNLQSVVARSMNAAILNQTGKYHGMQNMLRATTIASSITTPTFAVGKASQVTSSVAKGLGSLRTTLPGAAQSLKVFTAVSKNRPPICMNNGTRNTPLLPSTTILTSSSSPQNQQRVSNIQVKSIDSSSNIQKNEKRHVVNVTHQGIYSNSTVTSSTSEQTNSHVPLQAAITLNNYGEVGNTLLSEEGLITEQITASAVAENDDMAFLSAGEKFLEQLSAKMTASSPDSLNKNESFIYPGNMTLEVNNVNNERVTTNPTLYEISKNNNKYIGMVCSSNTTNISIVGDRIVSTNTMNTNQTKQSVPQKKDNSYILNPRIVSHNIGIVSSKISTQLLNNSLCFMNSKISSNVSIVGSSVSTEVTPKTVGLVSSLSSPLVVSLCRTSMQPKAEIPIRTVVSFPSTSKENTNVDNPNEDSHHFVISTTQGSIPFTCNENIVSANTGFNHTLSASCNNSYNTSKCIPAYSKLNISSFHGNNGSPSCIQPGNSNLLTNTDPLNQIKSNNISNTFFSVNNFQKNISIETLSSTTAHNNDKTSLLFSSIKQSLHMPSDNMDGNEHTGNGSDDLSLGKKRKLCDLTMVPARTQASWIRGAANLLARVSRFRGSNKQKGEMNAASWFTKPVDPQDAPGYYRIIRNPMDFGKIRRKLEDGEYHSYPNFYDDMMLIKKNCYSYNPVGHIARKDCDDVFSFFEGEYQKLLERWEKHHVSPHKKAKVYTEENANGNATTT